MNRFACALLLAACSSTPRGPTPDPGSAQRFEIGALEAFALADGYFEVPNDAKLLGVGRPIAEIADLLGAAGLPRDTVRLDFQPLLVRSADHVILFDTGSGDVTWAKAGHLLSSLAKAGVAPAAVTDIFISHAHGDHVGGLVTKSGALVFPAAAIHLSAPEWTSLQAEAKADPDGPALIAAITSKVVAFEPGAQILPEVKAVATPGHTPGHSSYEIGAGADKLFYLGDLAHHSVVSLQRPGWPIAVDGDGPAAEAMRQQTLARLAAERTHVFAFHFPFPGIGHIAADAGAFAWQPD